MIGHNANVSINREAVASATWGFPLCILGLNGSGSGLTLSGMANLTADNCVIWTNSTGSRSMDFSGGDATTKFFCAAGRAPVTGGTQLTPRPTENCDIIPDPLGDWRAPAAGTGEVVTSLSVTSQDPRALLRELQRLFLNRDLKLAFRAIDSALRTGDPLPDSAVKLITLSFNAVLATSPTARALLKRDGTFRNGPAVGLTPLEVAQILGIIDNLDPSGFGSDPYVTNPTQTLVPGTYIGLDISRGHVRMQPGVYHILDAPLIVRRKATLSGEGVTIIFHGQDATFSVTDQARATLSAPTDGETAGLLLAQDSRDAISGKPPRSRLTGSGSVSLIGTVYLPHHSFAITGDGAADQTSPMLQIVADSVNVSDNGALKIVFNQSETEVPAKIKPARNARLLR